MAEIFFSLHMWFGIWMGVCVCVSVYVRMLLIFEVLAANSWNNFAYENVAETVKAFDIIWVSML